MICSELCFTIFNWTCTVCSVFILSTSFKWMRSILKLFRRRLFVFQSVRFLSDIGGAMGLFLGASVLSFVEILQLILEMVLFLFRANHTSTTVKQLSKQDKLANSRKDSVFPVHQKMKTSLFDETVRNPSPDPHAVNSYSWNCDKWWNFDIS